MERGGQREEGTKGTKDEKGETGREGDRDTTTISSEVFLVIRTLTLLDQRSSLQILNYKHTLGLRLQSINSVWIYIYIHTQ